jgi:hypothetical protein
MANTILVSLAGAAVLVSTTVGAVVAAESQSDSLQTQEQNQACICDEPLQTQAQLRETEQLQNESCVQIQNQECLNLGTMEQNRLGQSTDVANALSSGYGETSEGAGPGLYNQWGDSQGGNSYGESGDGTGPGDQRQWGKS